MSDWDDEARGSGNTMFGLSMKKITTIAVFAFILVFGLIFSQSLIETVDKGTYQIKQAAVTGNMSVKMTPGVWAQMFGDIDVWPKAETFFFTADADTTDDVGSDNSIEVRFNDGSICNISGTARILMPTSDAEALSIVTERGHKTYGDVKSKLIKPTVRNVLRHTANLMSATESYSSRRGDFISWARDQIANGLYETTTERKYVTDLVSGEKVWTEVTVIKTDTGKVDGKPMYKFNPLAGSGIGIKNFEVKKFQYEDKVKTQIGAQQEARMAVNTAKAKAQEAEQDKLTIEAQGKARVAKAEYAELEKKAVVIVQAQRDKEQAIIKAEKQKEMESIAKEEAIIKAEKFRDVAQLDAKAADFEKQANILRGEGESSRKKMVMQADGALELKAKYWLAAQEAYAREFGKQKWVSEVTMGSTGDGNTGGDAVSQFMNLLSTKAAKDLALDMSMDTKTTN
jgi:regulator of protease activity HflC (stomatin/prohibitin superfamily)